ncbi:MULTISPECIES: DNA polymerase III subunit epsilon [unclassified Cellvibrio]|jgi:DNA polymerase-3 subunit epsilon|uniref:DNA polymerase III subunit epsilon n=1 Tax=unclassified Cellvibrio TaxID=2624793 RepID=UPI00124673DB|nr:MULTISPECIES: DNA polymerase III subunit epsilon [unclassified Cellvibrio]QEY13108.1 DNA polymerase III subunit epsilon [Cellvibrio sp. KY-YJ-3]UUA73630.1 DNA polymerase III subunit epsilon [Cellvibrio sp. QJXJ]
MRQIVLDTETTGLETSQGHRIIEIGCVELFNRRLTGRHYHQYINPEREIDAGAQAVHGISNAMLADKPVFARIADDFLNFVGDAELVIHNAAFDIGFINYELNMLRPGFGSIAERCHVVDTLLMARAKHPGQKNNLDALCKRYGVDNSQRELHGALLDAEILADVYLLMTGGQTALSLGGNQSKEDGGDDQNQLRRLSAQRKSLPVIMASVDELELHQQKLAAIAKASGDNCVWLRE